MPSVMMHYKAILEYFRLFHATTFSHLAQESSQEVGRQWGGQSQAVNFISQQLLFAHNLLFRYVVAGLNTVRIYFLKKKIFFLLLNFKLKNECIFSFFSAGSHHVFAGAVLCLHPISGRIRTI